MPRLGCQCWTHRSLERLRNPEDHDLVGALDPRCQPVVIERAHYRHMPRYDWNAIQRYFDEGHTYEECMTRFGYGAAAWTAALRNGKLRAFVRREELSAYLSRKLDRGQLRRRLLQEGVLTECCYECGITHWLGHRLSLHLDHINGENNDSRPENLRLLCPNCHSQTETFGARNVRRKRRPS